MSIIIVFVALVLTGVLGALVYLAVFARASRSDTLFTPPAGRGARAARRVTGVYVRDPRQEGALYHRGSPRNIRPGLDDGRTEDDGRMRGEQLVGR
ncbi:hypothetical protein [Actinomadura montaniterrae]|uniref:Uncharacterized protein n=1 Tax=Actinomadura montaniterrae TaxID=1803903 RepID=A0A6L3VSG4_9ACTN|nr:hypothetical protein [Actinomadura montaniterrae]KAB2379940.1 hypothetical protein F9B16_18745 [Actinomadura montaniterrae]